MKQAIKIAIIVLVVGLGASWYSKGQQAAKSPVVGDENPLVAEETDNNLIVSEDPIVPITTVTSSEVNAPVVSQVSGDYSVIVRDQLANQFVAVEKLIFSSAAWIAITEEKDGRPNNNVLGAAWFPAGVQENITVDLVRNTEPGRVYFAVIRTDSGDDHVFDYKKDLPVTDSNGNMVAVRFVALAGE